jgi:hypothetical protein
MARRILFDPERSLSWAEWRAIWSEVVARLNGRTCQFEQVEHRVGDDPNPGREDVFTTRWRHAVGQLDEACSPSSGNPRDGWGYRHSATLVIEGRLTITASSAAWTPELRAPTLVLEGERDDVRDAVDILRTIAQRMARRGPR